MAKTVTFGRNLLIRPNNLFWPNHQNWRLPKHRKLNQFWPNIFGRNRTKTVFGWPLIYITITDMHRNWFPRLRIRYSPHPLIFWFSALGIGWSQAQVGLVSYCDRCHPTPHPSKSLYVRYDAFKTFVSLCLGRYVAGWTCGHLGSTHRAHWRGATSARLSEPAKPDKWFSRLARGCFIWEVMIIVQCWWNR